MANATATRKKSYTRWNMLFDLFMTVITSGFWIIWVAIRYMRTH